MPDDDLTADDVRRMAAEIGMTGLGEEHLQQLLRATRGARARRTSLCLDSIEPADEPAHVFRL